MSNLKRRLSPTSREVGPPRRVHLSGSVAPTPLNFDLALYDELILNIFSHLSHVDLCSIQRTNSNWSRISLDNQLWKGLFINEFGRSRLRGSRGLPMRADGREIRPLPGRVHGQAKSIKDWKWMFRISSNWRTGRCATEELTCHSSEDLELPIRVILAGGMIVTASSRLSSMPPIVIHRSPRTPCLLSALSIPRHPFNQITSLALDQSQPMSSEYRLAALYITGNFSVFLVPSSNPKESAEILSYVSNARRHRTPIVQAVYHHPVLITLSTSFELSIYELPSDGSGGLRSGVRLTQTLTSFTSYPPTSLILTKPGPDAYKLVLAYSVPIYPSHWTIAVTELTISSFTVQSTQTTSAFDLTSGWSHLTQTSSETLRDQYSRKLSEVSSTSTDGKYVVLAGTGTNTIQLYRLSSRTTGPRLTFLRTLHGHDSPVHALYVADGRCVSLSRDGSLWIWDLENGGVEVDSESPLASPEDILPGSAQVLFDERRILVVVNGRITMRRFDM